MNTSINKLRTSVEHLIQTSAGRRVATTLCLILAESSIIYLFAGVILAREAEPHRPLPFLLIAALLIFAALVPGLLRQRRIWTPEYEFIMGISLVVSFLAMIKWGAFPDYSFLQTEWIREAISGFIFQSTEAARHVWGLVLLTAYAWSRGRTRAEPIVDTAYTMLRWGLVAVVLGITLVIVLAPEAANIRGTANLAVVSFLICTLFAIGLARQSLTGDESIGSLAIWLVMLGIPTIIIATTALSTVGVLTEETRHLLYLIVGPVFLAISFILSAFVLAVAIITFVLVAPLLWLISRYNFDPFGNLENLNIADRTIHDLDAATRSTLDIGDPLRYLLAISIIVMTGWLLVRFTFVRRKLWIPRRRPEHRAEGDHGTEAPSLIDRALDWLGVGRGRRRGDDLPVGAEWAHTRRIRVAYRQFLQIMASAGHSREIGQTPAEYADQLAPHYRNLATEIEELTQTYNRTRYSGNPSNSAEASKSETILKTLRKTLSERV